MDARLRIANRSWPTTWSVALGRQLNRAVFERAWNLSWLKVLAQVGFCLADPLVGTHSQEDVTRVRAQCRKAIDRAKRIADAHAV